MVEFEIKINPHQRLAYIPKEIFAVLTNHAKAIPNRAAVLFYSESTSTEDILESLEVIKADLIHAQNMEAKSQIDRLCNNCKTGRP